jgi:hypothetical protein
MTPRPSTLTARTAATVFVVAGLSFVTYPALRPYSDETTLDGAAAMASTAWVAAHTLGMVGFIALTLGVRSLHRLRRAGRAPRSGSASVALTWLGVSLVLPYYGAETFGVRVIAERALATGDASLLELVETFRYDTVALSFFATGLLLLAAAGIALARTLRGAAPTLRIGGLLVGAALATYLPQFFLAPSFRITHGVVLAAGFLLLAAGVAAGAATSVGAGAATGVGVAAATQDRDPTNRYSTSR